MENLESLACSQVPLDNVPGSIGRLQFPRGYVEHQGSPVLACVQLPVPHDDGPHCALFEPFVEPEDVGTVCSEHCGWPTFHPLHMPGVCSGCPFSLQMGRDGERCDAA